MEKADILELTVSQLRHMVANTEMQSVYGYSACVQEVNDFLVGIRYDDITRRRIVQHLCRRRPSLLPASRCTFSTRRVPAADAESTSGNNAADYEHLRMFSYSSADSTTDGANESCEAGSTATTAVVNSSMSTSCKTEVGEATNSTICVDRADGKVLYSAESTDDAHRKAIDTDEIGSNLQDDVVRSPVWRPW